MTPADDGVAKMVTGATPLSPVLITRLEKAAVDNGFDCQLSADATWIEFGSTQCPLRIWLGITTAGTFAAAFSQRNVAAALLDLGEPMGGPLPSQAVAGRTVGDVPKLHHLVRRAFQLAKTLPDELLHRFNDAIRSLPRSTEAERLVVQRVGQDVFRAGLMDYWEGRCAITGLAVPELLRASHIKPWASCETDAERLDVYNGLLLAPNFDALFDQGYVTLSESGDVIVSGALNPFDRETLGLVGGRSLRVKLSLHSRYLNWHRERVFRG